MNKMAWEDLSLEIKNKTDEEMMNELDSLFKQFPIAGEFVKERMERTNIRTKYTLLREFFNCDRDEFNRINNDLVLLQNGKEIKVGDSIYSYNTGWCVYIGIGGIGENLKPYCITLNRGIGFNKDSIRVGSANDAGEIYEIRCREDIPTDLHYKEMRGYKTKCTQLEKEITNKIKKGWCGYTDKEYALRLFNSFEFSYEELENFSRWDWEQDNGKSDSWYGNSCITDIYLKITLDTGYFKYSEKYTVDTYGYEY